MHDVDVALDWLRDHVSHVDNIRYRQGEWSIRLFVGKPSQHERPCHFHAPRFTDALDQALDYVIAYRQTHGLRGD